MKKTTKATFKAFVRKNRPNLCVNVLRKFDGTIDGERLENDGFTPAQDAKYHPNMVEHDLGIIGVWLVNGSMDYFKPYSEKNFTGIEVSNSCGLFIVAVREV